MSSIGVSAANRRSIALVTAGYGRGGGVQAVVDFLHRVITTDGRYRVEIVDVATSRADANSRRILNPGTWIRPPAARRTEDAGRVVHRVGANWTELESQRYLPRRILTELLDRFDLIQLVAGTPAWANVARPCRAPVILQVATFAEWEREPKIQAARGLSRIWMCWMTRFTARLDVTGLRRADLILAENQRMVDWIRSNLPSRRVSLTPPGIDVAEFDPNLPRERIVLFVGRLGDPRKNPGLLVEAFGRIASKHPGLRLVLAGHGELPHPLMEEIRDGRSAGRIVVNPNVDRHALVDLYQRASVFVLPSDEEGLGIALLEAMASGAPAVATRCGGPETVIRDGENGFLVPIRDAGKLAAAIDRLLSDDAFAQRIGRAGRRTVEAGFSLAAAGSAFVRCYDEVLAGETNACRTVHAS